MWKPITGYEGLYEVSDDGCVRSISRVDCRGQRTPEKLLKFGAKYSRDGTKPTMLIFTLCKDRTRRPAYLHHVVAHEFLGPRPEGTFVCHIDGDATNNKASNLYYGTPKENMADAMRHGTTLRGSKNRKAKLSEPEVREIKSADLSEYGTKTKLAKRLGVSLSTVASVSYGVNWGWLDADPDV